MVIAGIRIFKDLGLMKTCRIEYDVRIKLAAMLLKIGRSTSMFRSFFVLFFCVHARAVCFSVNAISPFRKKVK